MNKERRKLLVDIMNSISEAKSILEDALSDEEEYRDNIPENLQGSERYEKADNACSVLSDAITNIEEAIS